MGGWQAAVPFVCMPPQLLETAQHAICSATLAAVMLAGVNICTQSGIVFVCQSIKHDVRHKRSCGSVRVCCLLSTLLPDFYQGCRLHSDCLLLYHGPDLQPPSNVCCLWVFITSTLYVTLSPGSRYQWLGFRWCHQQLMSLTANCDLPPWTLYLPKPTF
jgi:hypothetical protein